MANQKSATNGTPKHTVAEIKKWYEENKSAIEKYTKAKDGADILRDVTQVVTPPSVQTINKEELKKLGIRNKFIRYELAGLSKAPDKDEKYSLFSFSL